uniref:F-box/WD repeat-containing protein A n=1 Tax=Anthurium amnicola TaxID=1678845 RepID=A0A1D1YE94_9ARAE
MQQQDGLSIIFYPTFPSARKRLHIHTWPTQFESHNRKDFDYSSFSNQQRQEQQIQLQREEEEESIKLLQCDDDDDDKQEEIIDCVIAGNDGFSKVPHEIMMMIMNDLEVTDIISLSMVNRKLRGHTQDNYLWKQILIKKYGESAIENHNESLSSSNPRKGKWKCKPKQIPSTPNWQKVYMSLSTVKIKTKTAYPKGRPGAFYRYRDFDIKDNDTCNNRLRQRQRYFNIEMTISNVPPGTYDVIWRMRVDKCPEKPIINFSTDIWLRHDIYLSSYEREAKYKYSPDPEELAKVFDKGWFHFRLPYQIKIAKIDNSDDRRYQVHTGIYCYTEKFTKSSSVKGPFSVEYVCLRPHIPYNHCPSNNDLNNFTAENEGETLYDNDYCDSIGDFSVARNSNFSVCDETVDKSDDKKKRRESVKSLIKHKRVSKLLCF